jgi:hypothetical protein
MRRREHDAKFCVLCISSDPDHLELLERQRWELDHPDGVITPEEQASMDNYAASQEGI